jgi:signal transduction histidine kinase
MLGPVGERRYKAYAGDILQSGHHLLAVVNDILDLAKIEAGHMELRAMPVDALATAKECLRLMEPRATAGRITLALDARFEGASAVVNADALRLRQVLLNLLSNAVKFTRPGGEVIVTVDDSSPNERAISIADTGIGMDEAALAIALMPFRQAATPLARKQEGTGLGLPLAKRLVELMGGVLEIDSAPGRGTRVQVRLPAAPARATA